MTMVRAWPAIRTWPSRRRAAARQVAAAVVAKAAASDRAGSADPEPPYATITALNPNEGTKVWQVAHGETPDNIKNNPALKGLTIPNGPAGPHHALTIVSAVIAGEGGLSRRGTTAWRDASRVRQGHGSGCYAVMPALQTGSPMTYAERQAYPVSIAGPGAPGELIVYRLGN